MTAIFFLLIVFAAAAIGWLPESVAVLYFILSIITLLIYGLDKWLALKGKRRISENKLHLLSLIGGWPGATIGQQAFQHKISKQSFRRLYYLTVLINLAAISVFLILKYQLGLIELDFTH
jgi:uncharacterized membrane protein YsdA (DUF1294 family)